MRTVSRLLKEFSISKLPSSIFKFFAHSVASIKLCLDVYLNGSIKHLTFSDPRASTEMAAHKAESIPPDNPNITPGKLFFST